MIAIEGRLYLAEHAYNSKTITWEVCKLDAILNEDYRITFLEDGTSIRIPKTQRNLREKNGKYGFVEESSLKELTKAWSKREREDVNAKMKVLHAREAVLLQVADQMNGSASNQAHR